jgi:hypothetical protein
VDCGLSLKFDTTGGATTGGFQAPTGFRGLVIDTATGLIAIQPNANAVLTGTISVQ